MAVDGSASSLGDALVDDFGGREYVARPSALVRGEPQIARRAAGSTDVTGRSTAGERHPTFRKLVLISLPSVVIVVAFFELGLFRLFLVVDNFPLLTFDRTNQILKYRPNQSGIRYPDRDRRNPVRYSINNDGWNSIHASYPEARTSRSRIAVIGDSYVEALQVDPSRSVAARLEALLGGTETEVFPFGISGAPLSQYLHVARYVTRTFHPDAVIVIIVHNDFIESYRPKGGRGSHSLAYVDLGDTVREVLPQPYESSPGAQALLAHSATARFVYYCWRMLVGFHPEVEKDGTRAAHFEANVDADEVVREDPSIQRAAAYLFGQFAELQRSTQTPFLFVMDSPREALYRGQDPRSLLVYRLNRIARDIAAEKGLAFVDLTDAFEEDYARSRQRFEFATDNHWNAHGHEVVAREVYRRLMPLLRQREASSNPGVAAAAAETARIAHDSTAREGGQW
jgi:hypothetical protein